ncbi:MAG: type II toxin-antitoxin system RelE/ParE family toxin [Eudoraea sp.]|uniref:type II toxin-antitoxin system RelE/ParE family toxin n=1 Tax=Eudoraea sp. TaxID=1979955 RepID=UPI003C7268D1
MARYILSKSALSDILAIADYTIKNFGIKQARKYRDNLISCFEDLTNRPERGRLCSHKDDTLLLRYRHKSHVVFYKRTNTGILIIRVLGERMDFIRHL